ncbi:nestin [Aplysia californica]|uniref:Nestin n=1 Tax=Aplysia californica TaxID=6500 RepID=A0ABM0JQF3_APLCA|nr:nestin [Aplysia californica]XP_005099119.1 nestin [Aplysia californica]XP_005099120.1 nestin [Aplysia californica]XP_012938404.1 nestin [Aplysia californica]
MSQSFIRSSTTIPGNTSVTEKRTVITSSSSSGSALGGLDDDSIYYKSSITPRASSIMRTSMPTSPIRTTRTVEMSSGFIPHTANVTATGVNSFKSNREREKKDLQDLNERFANYIEKVRFLEAQNKKLASELEQLRSHWGKETSAVKQMYETELEEARKLIDETNKEKARLQLRVGQLEEQLDDFQRQLDEAKKWRSQDRETINKLNQQVSELEGEIRMLRRTNDSLDTERARDKATIARLQEELEKLRIDLSNETIGRLDAENKYQTLLEEIEFLKSVHEQELKELSALAYRDTTAENREFWKNELSQAIRDIQQEYDIKVDQIRGEMETFYNLKVQEFRTGATKQNMEVTHAREETKKLHKQLADSRGRLSDLEARNAQLEKQYQELLRELEQKDSEHDLEINSLKEEMNKLRAEMEGMLVELQTLMDAKLSLELEIAAYRKLLEGEETRIPLRNSFWSAYTPYSDSSHKSEPISAPYRPSSSSSKTSFSRPSVRDTSRTTSTPRGHDVRIKAARAPVVESVTSVQKATTSYEAPPTIVEPEEEVIVKEEAETALRCEAPSPAPAVQDDEQKEEEENSAQVEMVDTRNEISGDVSQGDTQDDGSGKVVIEASDIKQEIVCQDPSYAEETHESTTIEQLVTHSGDVMSHDEVTEGDGAKREVEDRTYDQPEVGDAGDGKQKVTEEQEEEVARSTEDTSGVKVGVDSFTEILTAAVQDAVVKEISASEKAETEKIEQVEVVEEAIVRSEIVEIPEAAPAKDSGRDDVGSMAPRQNEAEAGEGGVGEEGEAEGERVIECARGAEGQEAEAPIVLDPQIQANDQVGQGPEQVEISRNEAQGEGDAAAALVSSGGDDDEKSGQTEDDVLVCAPKEQKTDTDCKAAEDAAGEDDSESTVASLETSQTEVFVTTQAAPETAEVVSDTVTEKEDVEPTQAAALLISKDSTTDTTHVTEDISVKSQSTEPHEEDESKAVERKVEEDVIISKTFSMSESSAKFLSEVPVGSDSGEGGAAAAEVPGDVAGQNGMVVEQKDDHFRTETVVERKEVTVSTGSSDVVVQAPICPKEEDELEEESVLVNGVKDDLMDASSPDVSAVDHFRADFSMATPVPGAEKGTLDDTDDDALNDDYMGGGVEGGDTDDKGVRSSGEARVDEQSTEGVKVEGLVTTTSVTAADSTDSSESVVVVDANANPAVGQTDGDIVTVVEKKEASDDTSVVTAEVEANATEDSNEKDKQHEAMAEETSGGDGVSTEKTAEVERTETTTVYHEVRSEGVQKFTTSTVETESEKMVFDGGADAADIKVEEVKVEPHQEPQTSIQGIDTILHQGSVVTSQSETDGKGIVVEEKQETFSSFSKHESSSITVEETKSVVDQEVSKAGEIASDAKVLKSVSTTETHFEVNTSTGKTDSGLTSSGTTSKTDEEEMSQGQGDTQENTQEFTSTDAGVPDLEKDAEESVASGISETTEKTTLTSVQMSQQESPALSQAEKDDVVQSVAGEKIYDAAAGLQLNEQVETSSVTVEKHVLEETVDGSRAGNILEAEESLTEKSIAIDNAEIREGSTQVNDNTTVTESTSVSFGQVADNTDEVKVKDGKDESQKTLGISSGTIKESSTSEVKTEVTDEGDGVSVEKTAEVKRSETKVVSHEVTDEGMQKVTTTEEHSSVEVVHTKSGTVTETSFSTVSVQESSTKDAISFGTQGLDETDKEKEDVDVLVQGSVAKDGYEEGDDDTTSIDSQGGTGELQVATVDLKDSTASDKSSGTMLASSSDELPKGQPDAILETQVNQPGLASGTLSLATEKTENKDGSDVAESGTTSQESNVTPRESTSEEENVGSIKSVN